MNLSRGPSRRVVAVVLGAVIALFLTSCGRVVSGSAQPAGGSDRANTRPDEVNSRLDKLDKLLRECDILSPKQIETAVGKGTAVDDSFFGAVCMWDLRGGPSGRGMVTLNWYENGTLSNEKQTNNKLGYHTTNITVEGSLALRTQRPNDPDSCGVTASAPDRGVIGWWVNYEPGSNHTDPCGAAVKLMEMTLNLAR
ncbi:DUF3558 domain-containing protein [Nocardia sp. CNY236]|uniref:DUF3558 domain-containing protein n=1 Tax=Nocardia sp. CNY236 TaxID=1169152 RepID=UPI000427023C|nr:DUF3558 domain-containing protein [Nocardia sp. CNY236]